MISVPAVHLGSTPPRQVTLRARTALRATTRMSPVPLPAWHALQARMSRQPHRQPVGFALLANFLTRVSWLAQHVRGARTVRWALRPAPTARPANGAMMVQVSAPCAHPELTAPRHPLRAPRATVARSREQGLRHAPTAQLASSATSQQAAASGGALALSMRAGVQSPSGPASAWMSCRGSTLPPRARALPPTARTVSTRSCMARAHAPRAPTARRAPAATPLAPFATRGSSRVPV